MNSYSRMEYVLLSQKSEIMSKSKSKLMEQETKNCPYCGEVIMATAKKCKHCGEWQTDRKKPNGKKANQPKVKAITSQLTQLYNDSLESS